MLKEKYLELMQKKVDAMERMASITRERTFTGEYKNVEQEVESFTSLYQRRTNILNVVEKVDDELSMLEPLEDTDVEDTDFQAKFLGFNTKMKNLQKKCLT